MTGPESSSYNFGIWVCWYIPSFNKYWHFPFAVNFVLKIGFFAVTWAANTTYRSGCKRFWKRALHVWTSCANVFWEVTNSLRRRIIFNCLYIPHSFPSLFLRGYCTPGPYFWSLCAFSQKIKQPRTKYPMDLVRNVPRN